MRVRLRSAEPASSFDLYGQYRNQHIAAASFGWDPTGTQLTINYNHLSGDTYRLTLFAGGFQDLVGHAVSSDFTVDFADLPTSPRHWWGARVQRWDR